MIPIYRHERLESFIRQGYELIYDPSGDGNCQFSAMVYALAKNGIYRSPATIRNDVITYLTTNDLDSRGFPLELFAGMPWSEYLQDMARDGTYGDEITLQPPH